MPSETSEVWHLVEGFPPQGEEVTAVIAGGPGFVAVGHGAQRGDGCATNDNGRIWWSLDGQSWTEATGVDISDVTLRHVVATNAALYAFGQVAEAGCQGAIVAFRSVDGTRWERIAANLKLDEIEGIAAAGSRVILVGYWSEPDGTYGSGAWTSADGSTWEEVAGEPPFASLFGLDRHAALGDLVVLPDSWSTSLAWYSTDGGKNWQRSDFGPLQRVDITGAAAANGRIVVSASACCSLLDVHVGLTYVTTDGQNWQVSEAFAQRPDALVALPGGFMTIGDETWLSTDGMGWRLGPQFPDDLDRWESMTAAGPAGVLVINPDRTWIAAPGSISASSGDATPAVAAMPQIGARYRYEHDLWCGWIPIWLDLRTWLPDPPVGDGQSPPGYPDQDGRTEGWLTLVSENELSYESRRDPTLTLRPSDEPVAYGPCA